MNGDLILVVDDEPKTRETLSAYLTREGYAVTRASDGDEALRKIREMGPSLVILDLVLPKTDGWEVCRQVRAFSEVPIVILTSRDDPVDRVVGLEMGADDYVTKPFNARELVARVRAILKRRNPQPQAPDILSQGGITVNRSGRTVFCDGSEVRLTPKEFDLLWFMMSSRGMVCSRETLLVQVWGYDYIGDVRTVDTHINSLREKLGAECSRSVHTVWGIGYRFIDAELSPFVHT